MEHKAQREGKLISFLREEMGVSARAVQRLAKDQRLRVNHSTARLYQPIKVGDFIEVLQIEEEPLCVPEEGELSVLYEDDFILLLDKPVGITMHPTSARDLGTLANRIAWYYQEKQIKAGIHFLNRLDRDTFGVVLVAKDSQTHATMSAQLQKGIVKKIYHALVFGRSKVPTGDINLAIGKVEGNPILRMTRADGQAAITAYREMATGRMTSLLELSPQTGRTHQLRVHCAAMGFPIVGDEQYGSIASKQFSKRHKLTTQQLQSYSLTFLHPNSKQPITIKSKLKLVTQALL